MTSTRATSRLTRRLLALGLALSVGASAGAMDLPDIGDSGGAILSPEQERRVGEAAVQRIVQSRALVDDPLLDEYIQSLGYQLLAASDTPGMAFRFFVVDAPDINAFALPGGFIGIHSGLLLATESESELAGVVAHEIAHITQRHYARRYENLGQSNLTTAAAVIAAIILGSQNSELGEAAIASAMAGSIQQQVNFTRANEKEADWVGIGLLAKAGYDPHGMPAFFERLQQATRLYGPEAPEFLRTHPVNVTRISDSRSRAAQYPNRALSESPAYHLMRARLRVLTQSPRAALEHFEQAIKTGAHRNKEAEQYGLALALLANNRPEEALEALKPLLAKDPHRIAYVIAQAQAEAAAGRFPKAGAVFREGLALSPYNLPLTVHYAEMQLEAGQAQEAKQLLQTFLRYANPTPRVYELLSQAAAKSGDRAETHRAAAEYHYARGQLHEAINQLSLALRQAPQDFHRTSQLEARLAQIQEEARALYKDEPNTDKSRRAPFQPLPSLR